MPERSSSLEKRIKTFPLSPPFFPLIFLPPPPCSVMSRHPLGVRSAAVSTRDEAGVQPLIDAHLQGGIKQVHNGNRH